MRKHLCSCAFGAPRARSLAAFGPGAGRRSSNADRHDRHDPHRGSQRRAQVRRSGNGPPGRRPENRQRNQPEKGRPAHLLAGHQRLAAEDPGARKNCFTPKHICLSIAKWHGFNENGRSHDQPGQSGPRRLEHAGQRSKKGDSWFTGDKERASFSQQVTAEPAPPTIYFMCAIHPWMQGSVKVLPAGTSGTSEQSTSTPRLGRRAFLGALGGGALAVLLPPSGGGALLPFGERTRRRSRRCRSRRGCRSRGS